jgi:hypothetical protein
VAGHSATASGGLCGATSGKDRQAGVARPAYNRNTSASPRPARQGRAANTQSRRLDANRDRQVAVRWYEPGGFACGVGEYARLRSGRRDMGDRACGARRKTTSWG